MLNKIRIVKDMKNQLINSNNFDKYEMTLPQIVDQNFIYLYDK